MKLFHPKYLSINAFLIFLFLFHVVQAQAQSNWSELDSELESKQKLLGNNLVAMIWKGDSLVYKKEMGGFTSKTQAPIASCSKWLTAALVMKFVEEGKLSLDDKVVKYIPEFDKYFKGHITIRQCMSHMTGISDDEKLLKRILQRKKFASLEEEVNDMAARDIRSKPGTDFWYGNVGLNIAGRVLEVISKKKFDALIKSKLLIPLGMTKTSFTDATGTPVNPSGGAKSTADDYMKFLVMLLNKGKHNGVQFLSGQSVTALMQVQNTNEQIAYAPKSAAGYTYALGSWVAASKPGSPGSKGEGIVVTSPGLFGTWPLIDYCRGYAYIVFVKNFLVDERANAHEEIKRVVDRQITSNCR